MITAFAAGGDVVIPIHFIGYYQVPLKCIIKSNEDEIIDRQKNQDNKTF